LILIVIGVFVYELCESPIVDERENTIPTNNLNGHVSQNGLIEEQSEQTSEIDVSDEIL